MLAPARWRGGVPWRTWLGRGRYCPVRRGMVWRGASFGECGWVGGVLLGRATCMVGGLAARRVAWRGRGARVWLGGGLSRCGSDVCTAGRGERRTDRGSLPESPAPGCFTRNEGPRSDVCTVEGCERRNEQPLMGGAASFALLVVDRRRVGTRLVRFCNHRRRRTRQAQADGGDNPDHRAGCRGW